MISGEVTLSFIAMYDRGNMVAANKPVMGKDTGNEGKPAPLVTGGQYNIAIKQGNKVLKPSCYFNVSLPESINGGVDDEMIYWKGAITEKGNQVWEETDDNIEKQKRQDNKHKNKKKT